MILKARDVPNGVRKGTQICILISQIHLIFFNAGGGMEAFLDLLWTGRQIGKLP
jgi:type III secretory pathway component EscT